MTTYRDSWDLTTIPHKLFDSERARRQRLLGSGRPNVSIKPCTGCGEPLTATERRSLCPHCKYRHPRKVKP